eukprot:7015929-Pyramimonas_sp.AAC.1
MPPSWRSSSGAERQAGADLLKLLLQLYASCRITAKHLCTACDLCTKANVPGGSFQLYAKEEGLQSGKYSDHIQRVLPHTTHLYYVPVPMNVNHSVNRTIRNVPVRLGYETLRDELQADPAIMETVQAPPSERAE